MSSPTASSLLGEFRGLELNLLYEFPFNFRPYPRPNDAPAFLSKRQKTGFNHYGCR